MEKELIHLYEAASKSADAAVDGGPEEDRCIDALNRLKKFPVSYHVLVSTQVGKRLRGLTKHNRIKIKVLASEVVDIWEDVIVKETLKNTKNGEINNIEGSVNVEKVEAVKMETMSSVKTEGNGPTGAYNFEKAMMNSESDKTVMKADAVETQRSPSVEQTIKDEKGIKEEKSSSVGPLKLNSITYCKDAVRDKVREMLADALCRVSSEVDEDLRDEVNACDPYRVAVLVETAMFEKWGNSNGAQTLKYKSVMFNINDPNNPDFRRKVLLGEFAPHTITELTPEQQMTSEARLQIEAIKHKEVLKYELGILEEASTDVFKCMRCWKRETTYFQINSDEGMTTTYVTCINCGNRWKFR